MSPRLPALVAVLLVSACRDPSSGPPVHGPAQPAAPHGAVTAVPEEAFAFPPSPGDPCGGDDECVASNFAGCCACPQCSQADPHARNRAAEEREQASCAVASCDMAICGVAGMCPPGEEASHFVARCREAMCVLERR